MKKLIKTLLRSFTLLLFYSLKLFIPTLDNLDGDSHEILYIVVDENTGGEQVYLLNPFEKKRPRSGVPLRSTLQLKRFY